MKKLLQILSASIVSVTCMGGMAFADPTSGVITLTGPGSNNTFTDNENNLITFTCNNNIVTATKNYQNAESGSGNVSDNNLGGSVATGQAFNVNSTNVTVGVTGCACSEAIFTAATCPVPIVPVAAPAPAVAAVAPGGGGAAPEETPSGGGGELPNTASLPAPAIALTSLAAVAGAFGASRLIVTTYRRFMK